MRNRDQLHRLLKALLAGAAIGVGELALVKYVLLPRLARGLSSNALPRLRAAFETHPVWFLLALCAMAAVLALPVLLVTLRIAGLGGPAKLPVLLGRLGTGHSSSDKSTEPPQPYGD